MTTTQLVHDNITQDRGYSSSKIDRQTSLPDSAMKPDDNVSAHKSLDQRERKLLQNVGSKQNGYSFKEVMDSSMSFTLDKIEQRVLQRLQSHFDLKLTKSLDNLEADIMKQLNKQYSDLEKRVSTNYNNIEDLTSIVENFGDRLDAAEQAMASVGNQSQDQTTSFLKQAAQKVGLSNIEKLIEQKCQLIMT